MSQRSASSSCSTASRCDEIVDLSSYKLIKASTPTEIEYEGEPVYCKCNLKAPRRCSWTETNPGRRFYSCQRFPVKNCKFLRWYDGEFPPRAASLIVELRRRENKLYQHAKLVDAEKEFWKQKFVSSNLFEVEAENSCLLSEMAVMQDRLKSMEVSAKTWSRKEMLVLLVFVFCTGFVCGLMY